MAGARGIRIEASGGVASPTDPIWMHQHCEDEIRAIVNETTERGCCTAARCHAASAIRRRTECGVRSIEHGTLIDDEPAGFVAEAGNGIVPTTAIIFGLKEAGREPGFPEARRRKVDVAHERALSGMDSMRRAGLKIGFGTDLLGKLHAMQCRALAICRADFAPFEILRQATSLSAEMMMLDGQLGCVAAAVRAGTAT